MNQLRTHITKPEMTITSYKKRFQDALVKKTGYSWSVAVFGKCNKDLWLSLCGRHKNIVPCKDKLWLSHGLDTVRVQTEKGKPSRKQTVLFVR